ncbi:MAG: cell division protein ZapE, partial [Nitrosomonas sp.]|nr:cell division protein ZapE [Nitrosomonas sp.]
MLHAPAQKSPETEYHALISAGELQPDADQAKAVAALERLHRELINSRTIGKKWPIRLLRWFGNNKSAPKGIYLHGGVGRGKSMLMDLFYTTIPITSKTRVHFHEFMLDIHAQLKSWHEFSVRERAQQGFRAS